MLCLIVGPVHFIIVSNDFIYEAAFLPPPACVFIIMTVWESGFWESGILGKWDFGKVRIGKVGFRESGISGK